MLADRAFPPLVDSCLFLAGPTAVGKSAVGLEIAKRMNGEILSLDSIAVYRGMDIGTAKPTIEQRRLVPHHLLDLAEPCEEFSVSRFLEAAHAAVSDILDRGKLPIFVGGTPMYLKGLLRGFFVGPPADWEFRRSVEEDLLQYGSEALHRRLQQVDPLAAHRLPHTDVRRITRALEVARLSGRPLSHWQVQFEEARSANDCRMFALQMPREVLVSRIEKRVDNMFAQGLVEEVRGLSVANENGLGRTASQAVGYREVLAFLAGQISIEEAIAAVKLHTVQMAKRQRTWLRSLTEVRNIDVGEAEPTSQVADKVELLAKAFLA
jgi:tRNA dimethylallyltransferase